MTRNETICKLYREGKTQKEIAEIYKISIQRTGQILNKQGLQKTDRPKVSPFKRGSYIGIHLTEGVKIAAREEAKEENKSLSLFISDLLVQELKNRGRDIKKPTIPGEIDIPLPLEG